MKSSATGSASSSRHRRIAIAHWTVLCLLLAFGAAHAQTFVPTSVAVSGINQTVTVGAVLPQRFAVRITDLQGQPLAGVRVSYHINLCLEGVPPPGGGCPPFALYGRFDTTNGGSEVVSDANGLATSDAFVAGSLAGQYQMFSYMPAQQVGSLQIPSNTDFRFFEITQVPAGVAPAASAIPTTTGWGLLAMMLLLVSTAMVRLRATPA